jgi:hypothetical protein
MNSIHSRLSSPTVSVAVIAGGGSIGTRGADVDGLGADRLAGAGRGGPVTASTLVLPLAIHAAISSSYRICAAGDPH